MNKAIVYLFYALMSFYTTTFYAQVSNSRQTANNNAQDGLSFYHTVEQGETVFSISRTYDVDTNAIYRLNPGSRELIKTGQQLKIPQRGKPDASKQAANAYEWFIYHTIQPKETLFSVSQKYHIKAQHIMDANPGLSTATFQIGKNIRIPAGLEDKESVSEKPQADEVKYIDYKVEKRETIFRLTRRFEITEAQLIALNPKLKNGLKDGMILKIPVKSTPAVSRDFTVGERDANALLNQQFRVNRPDTVKIALLLPFMIGEASSSNASRFIEYYEGLLLAVDSLQKNGVTLKLTVRDCGYGIKKLSDILKEKALSEAHMIIGGVDNDQIELLGSFANSNNIKYVIPFSSRNDDVRANANILQINTPHSYLFSLAAQTVYNIFRDCNIIFVDTKDIDDKSEFIGLTKQELSQHNIFFRDVIYDKETFNSEMEKVLRKDKRNLIIPVSGKLETLNKIKQPLRSIAEKTPEIHINLFGYPEWQTYIRETLDDFFFFDTYIYSNFYADNRLNAVNRFNTKYRIWYSKALNGFPKFGMLGFDTGMFFIDAIARYGINFENSIEKLNYRGLQMSFRFRRVNNWGGFINSSLFIIHYSKDNLRIQWQEVKL